MTATEIQDIRHHPIFNVFLTVLKTAFEKCTANMQCFAGGGVQTRCNKAGIDYIV